jgi:hypothetical protein
MSRRLAGLSVPLVLAVAAGLPAVGAPIAPAELTSPFPHPKGYVCYRAPSPIAIDGDLKDAAWEAAPWTDEFVDIEGDKWPKPRHRTRAKMLWDGEALYIAAEMEEPHLWATLKDRDSVIYWDNDFEVFLDPDGDNHLYGELEVNALNTAWDLLLTKPYRDQGTWVGSWDIIGLKTGVKLDGTLNDPRDKDKGWTLEIKWPWKGLTELVEVKRTAIPPKDGQQMRVNCSRVQWDLEVEDGKYRKVKGRDEHNWVWSPQGVIDMHRPERWGYLQFSTAKPGTAEFKPDPDWEIRDTLHRVFHAQLYHRKDKGRFAPTVKELGLKMPEDRLSLDAARNSFTLEWTDEKTGKPKYTITHDGRIVKPTP